MTVLSYYARTAGAQMPATFTEAEQFVKAHQAISSEIPAPLSDEAREQLIEVYSRHVEEFMFKATGADRATWLSYAQSAMHRRDALIRGRSAAQVRRLEIKRGLI